jgi:hypothetical protein
MPLDAVVTGGEERPQEETSRRRIATAVALNGVEFNIRRS